MHEIMVKPLPPKCRLTAIFDVSQGQQYDMVWQHADDVRTPQSCHSGTALGLSSFDAPGFMILTCCIEDLPYLVCTPLLITAPSLLDVFRMQYDSHGEVKPFGYMDGPWVLQQKASNADVVRIVFSNERLPRVVFPQVSLSGSKDNQEALETDKGGALKWVGLVQMVFPRS